MATIKSFTDVSQSKVLAEILPIESADVYYALSEDESMNTIYFGKPQGFFDKTQVAWSLAALLNILHSRQRNIPSLSGGGYKDGKYISDWCLDYEFENGDYHKTFADNPVDACVAIIERLHELNLL